MVVEYKTAKVNNINIFYREAGDNNNPTILLLHGFPSSSHMYRNLIPKLSDTYHVVAPDYPGFGNSDQPAMSTFEYSFSNLAMLIAEFVDQLGLTKFSIYVHDYGAPVGFRLAVKHPEKIATIITQNGNAYEEGLLAAWDPIRAYWEQPTKANKDKLRPLLELAFTKHQYTDGTRHPERISPDAWNMDQFVLDRPGNDEIQLALYYDYQNNVKQYSEWHKYFRTYQPPTLVAWGKNDMFFGPQGALAFQNDLNDCDVHLLNTGHFPLEEDLETSANLIKLFLKDRLK
ncbi:Pimeloyl-ACP methyl ester carboxylesterase [Amphibacillus marinus]|uniref:Pimeloyl-ACP methyl ester carboxylesterase n=1 Tax=Amphibacillus marinus TaxID=872970 RepID=A0A1H8KLF6_9BACI|nr:alpha/beta hydrolase [Amphibacillus marinus]SEN93752.1 Pimeloyl-ACP methyl ester carboxylesterase [Amphibacillus marinus]